MNRNSLRVAAVQMSSGADVSKNLADIDKRVAQAAHAGASLVALPEYAVLMSPDPRAKLGICEPDGDGPIQQALADCARRHGVWLVSGTAPLDACDAEHVRNSCLVFDANGQRAARYDKLHLFSFTQGSERYDEAATIEAGSETVAFDAPCGRTGLAICYDLRFPELFRQLGVLDLLILPAAFTVPTGAAHWEVLLRARAIENQCYVLAAAQTGTHPGGRRTWGHSMLIDPWGEILSCLEHAEGIVVGDLDPARIADVRERLPALRHRKLT